MMISLVIKCKPLVVIAAISLQRPFHVHSSQPRAWLELWAAGPEGLLNSLVLGFVVYGSAGLLTCHG